MYRNLKLTFVMVVVASVVFFAGLKQAPADTLLFGYGLPTQNLNGYGPPDGPNYNPNRSNGSPSLVPLGTSPPTSYSIEGDRFTLGHPGQQFQINTASLWMIWGSKDINGNDITQYSTTAINTTGFPNLTLWGGENGTIAPRSSNPTVTRAYYADGENMQRGSDGAWRALWQVDFHLTGAIIDGGQNTYYFLDGLYLGGDGNYYAPPLLAANVSDGGVTIVPSGVPADNTFLSYNTGTGQVSTASPFLPGGRPADASIAIYGSEVPLPSAIWLLGSGLLGLAGWRMRQR